MDRFNLISTKKFIHYRLLISNCAVVIIAMVLKYTYHCIAHHTAQHTLYALFSMKESIVDKESNLKGGGGGGEEYSIDSKIIIINYKVDGI